MILILQFDLRPLVSNLVFMEKYFVRARLLDDKVSTIDGKGGAEKLQGSEKKLIPLQSAGEFLSRAIY